MSASHRDPDVLSFHSGGSIELLYTACVCSLEESGDRRVGDYSGVGQRVAHG